MALDYIDMTRLYDMLLDNAGKAEMQAMPDSVRKMLNSYIPIWLAKKLIRFQFAKIWRLYRS